MTEGMILGVLAQTMAMLLAQFVLLVRHRVRRRRRAQLHTITLTQAQCPACGHKRVQLSETPDYSFVGYDVYCIRCDAFICDVYSDDVETVEESVMAAGIAFGGSDE